MGNRNRKKEGNPIVAIAVILIVLIISAGGGAAIPILLVLGAVGYSAYIAAERSKGAKKTDSDTDTASAAAPQSFDAKKIADEAKRSISKVLTQDMKKHDFDDCGDDHEHVEPSYNMPADEKRREQLKSMLKNGLIEKDEYEILMRKYGL